MFYHSYVGHLHKISMNISRNVEKVSSPATASWGERDARHENRQTRRINLCKKKAKSP